MLFQFSKKKTKNEKGYEKKTYIDDEYTKMFIFISNQTSAN